MDTNSRVLIAAGGTGGHVFPGLAVANGLRAQGVDVQWVGTARGIESRLVPAHQLQLHFIRAMGMRGKRFMQRLQAIPRLISSVWSAFVIMRKVKPHCVLGMGGFVSGPVGLMAVLMRKPLLLQEQNTYPGTTNKLLLPFARKVFVGFPTVFADSAHTNKVLYTGNPLREDIYALPEPAQRGVGSVNRRRVLVLGGSQGAHALNAVVPEAVAKYQPHDNAGVQIEVWHQTGESDQPQVADAYQRLAVSARVDAFISDMAEAYAWADVVIARSGALTVSELVAVGVPAILVPYPYAIDDHQRHNAQWMVDAGAAKILLQASLTPDTLIEALNEWLDDASVLLSAAEKARAAGQRNSTRVIVEQCLEVVNG